MTFPTITTSANKIFLIVLGVAVLAGVGTGYALASGGKTVGSELVSGESSNTTENKTAGSDNKTFRDFAEGTIQKKPEPKDPTEYSEGTHMLVRDGALPVALTSSVVDLAEYENKKVKVHGETMKALKEGWLMDVGKVEVK